MTAEGFDVIGYPSEVGAKFHAPLNDESEMAACNDGNLLDLDAGIRLAATDDRRCRRNACITAWEKAGPVDRLEQFRDDARAATVLLEEPDRRPANVIEALAWVQARIGGIAKMTPRERQRAGRPADQGITFAYRGIDQIAQAAQPLFGEAGIVILPNTQSFIADPITKGQGGWTRSVVLVEWTVFGPGGLNDKITSLTYGEGDDNSDKGYNKAMTGAFKNLLLRILCIGDPADDTDNRLTPDRTGGPQHDDQDDDQDDAGETRRIPAEDPRAPGSVTDNQLAAIARGITDAGLRGRRAVESALELLTGHPVPDTRHLTHTEAIVIIRRLADVRDAKARLIADTSTGIVTAIRDIVASPAEDDEDPPPLIVDEAGPATLAEDPSPLDAEEPIPYPDIDLDLEGGPAE